MNGRFDRERNRVNRLFRCDSSHEMINMETVEAKNEIRESSKKGSKNFPKKLLLGTTVVGISAPKNNPIRMSNTIKMATGDTKRAPTIFALKFRTTPRITTVF